jgi:CubicO group peptidase (beta-lactamase class C family)
VDPAHWAGRLAGLAEAAAVPGAVLGVWADGELTVTPYGVLSTRTGVETTADSVFQIGSITKTWTATMVVQLAEEGRLTYDTPVAELLPGVRLGRDDASATITVRHLLTHSSGLEGDLFDDTGRGDEAVEKYVALLADVGRAFEPGAAYSYCNSGFVVLGRIVEVLDDRTWDASLQARLVEPLGLTDTVTLAEDAILRRVAVGHKGPTDQGAPYGAWALPRSAGPAGVIATTAADLLTFARLHADRGVGATGDRLLAEESVLGMQERQLPIPDNPLFSGVGLSWRVGRWSGTAVMAHDGGTIGQVAALRVLPELGVAVCVLSNGDNGDALVYPLVREVLREVTGVQTPAVSEPDPRAAPTGLDRHAGRYERRGIAFEVAVDEDEHLAVTVVSSFGLPGVEDDVETVALLPIDGSGDRFVGRSDLAQPWWLVTFASLPDGRAQLFSSGRVAPRVT